jgi:hypothetical protein
MPRSFADTLKDIRDGALVTELPTQLTDLITAILATRKSGSLTLKLTIKPIDRDSKTLLIVDTVKVDAPEPDRGTTIAFATEENDLTRRDPRQPDLPGVRGVVKPLNERQAEG